MTAPVSTVHLRPLLEAIYLLRQDAVQIDSEWGSGRTVEQIRETHDEDKYGYPQVRLSDELEAFIPDESDVLDPEPWVIDYGRSMLRYRVDEPLGTRETSDAVFQPRRGYSQNREDYS